MAIKITPGFRQVPCQPGSLKFFSRERRDTCPCCSIPCPPAHDALAKGSQRHPAGGWWWQKPFLSHGVLYISLRAL